MAEPKIENGCILLARKILISDIWKKPSHYLKIWVYILSKAQHKNYKGLQRGQLITSIPEIIEDCSWYVGYRKEKLTKDQVFQVLQWLRKPHESSCESNAKATMITTTKATQKLLITIENYDFYQTLSNYEGNAEIDNEKDVKATREQRQPNNINKNEKNVKNENNENNNNTDLIFQYWNNVKAGIHHQDINSFRTEINRALKRHKPEEVKAAIKRLSIAYHDTSYFYKQKWNLNNFLKQANGLPNWLDEGQYWNAYVDKKGDKSIGINKQSDKSNQCQEETEGDELAKRAIEKYRGTLGDIECDY